MAQDHTHGNQLTLYAAAYNLYNINIHIISSLGAGASHVFHPGLKFQQQHCSLDTDFAENDGEHYIALNGLTQEENIVVDVLFESVANRVEENHTKVSW